MRTVAMPCSEKKGPGWRGAMALRNNRSLCFLKLGRTLSATEAWSLLAASGQEPRGSSTKLIFNCEDASHAWTRRAAARISRRRLRPSLRSRLPNRKKRRHADRALAQSDVLS